MTGPSKLPRTTPWRRPVLAAALAALGPVPATAMADDKPPTTFFTDRSQVMGLAVQAGSSTLDRTARRRVKIRDGRPATPAGWEIYDIRYNAFGDVISSQRRRIPARPAVPPVYAMRSVRVGGLSVACELERVGATQYRVTSLTVTADGDKGTHSAALAQDTEAFVKFRARRGTLEARLAAKLDDGSVLRLTGTGGWAVLSDASQPAFFDLHRSSLTGPLAAATARRTRSVAGTWTIAADAGRPEFDVSWSDSSHGEATFTAPASLAGHQAAITRSPTGDYTLVGAGAEPLRMLIRPDGSGTLDIGYGEQLFDAGVMLRGDASEVHRIDPWDPTDDSALGATALTPTVGGTTLFHSLSRRDSEDWYRIDLTWGSRHSLQLTDDSGELVVELRDANLQTIGSTGEFPAVRADTNYFVRVLRNPLAGSPLTGSRTYSLAWSEIGDSPVSATPLAPTSGGRIDALSLANGDHHWYRLDAQAGSRFTIGTTPSVGAGFAVNVYGDDYAQLGTVVNLDATHLTLRAAENRPLYLDVHSTAPSVSYGLQWTESTDKGADLTLAASDSASNDNFGGALAIDGNTAVVGARGKSVTHGAAYVFVRSSGQWSQQQELVATDAVGGIAPDSFGTSVAVSGDTAVVGSVYAWTDSNRQFNHASGAYVFVRSLGTWSLQQKLSGINAGISPYPGPDGFGSADAVSGDTLAVTASGSYSRSPVVHVYVRSGTLWSLQQTLTYSNGYTGLFGSSLALAGDTLVVGAPAESGSNWEGEAQVYVRSGGTWTLQQRLSVSGGAPLSVPIGYDVYGNAFGKSVALSGDRLLVGAPGPGDRGRRGLAYVYIRANNAWTRQQILSPIDGAGSDWFGNGVALIDDVACVTSPGRGASYAFTLAQGWWNERHVLTGAAGPVVLAGDTALVASPLASSGAGSVYGFAAVDR